MFSLVSFERYYLRLIKGAFMKNISFFAFVLLLSINVVAMDSQDSKGQALAKDASPHELTATEKSCYEWYVEQQKKLSSPYQKLSSEDIAVFNNRINYTDNPEAVTRSRNNFVEVFYTLVHDANIKIEYDKETLQRTFLKMTKAMHTKSIEKPTDVLSARMYVFSQKLTEQEKSMWTQINYLKNPQEAEKVVLKWSDLVSKELAKLKLIVDTKEARELKSQELFDEKLAFFKKSYIKDK